MFVIVISGHFIFPLFVSLWLPKPHFKHRSKNDILIDFIGHLDSLALAKNQTLSEIELSFDSAYCVQKVMQAVSNAQLRVITKPNNNHQFEFEGQKLTPAELIEKVKKGHWKSLDSKRLYQRLCVYHHSYGEVVLIVRMKTLKNDKIIYDVLLCNTCFYEALLLNDTAKLRFVLQKVVGGNDIFVPKRSLLCRVGKMPSNELAISTLSHGSRPLNDSMFQ